MAVCAKVPRCVETALAALEQNKAVLIS